MQQIIKKNNNDRGHYFGLFIILILVGCTDYFEKDIDDFTWNGGIAINVGSITYNVSELFKEITDENIRTVENDENITTFTYTENLISEKPVDFIEIPNKTFEKTLKHGINSPIPSPIKRTVSVEETFKFDIEPGGNEEFTKAIFKGGNLILTINSTFDTANTYILSIPSLIHKTTNNPYKITFGTSPSDTSHIETVPLEDYYADYTKNGEGGLSFNNFIVEIMAKINVEIGTIITSNNRIDVRIELKDISTESIYGDFKTQSFNIKKDTIDLGIFENFGRGNLYFADPSIRINIKNSFGIPFKLDFSKIEAVNSEGQRVSLSNKQPEIISSPTIDQVGENIYTEIFITAQNSNIADLLSIKPAQFVFDITAESNPANNPNAIKPNFLLHDSTFEADLEVEIPLNVNFENIELEETIDFNNRGDLDKAKQLSFIVNTENKMPISGSIKLQFLDEQNTVVHVTDEKTIFNAATVGADGRTSTPSLNNVEINFSEAEISKIKNAVKINLIAKLSTSDNSASPRNTIKLYADYELKINLAMKIDVELTND